MLVVIQHQSTDYLNLKNYCNLISCGSNTFTENFITEHLQLYAILSWLVFLLPDCVVCIGVWVGNWWLLIWTTFGWGLLKRWRSFGTYHWTPWPNSSKHCSLWEVFAGVFQQTRSVVKAWIQLILTFKKGYTRVHNLHCPFDSLVNTLTTSTFSIPAPQIFANKLVKIVCSFWNLSKTLKRGCVKNLFRCDLK